MRVRADAGARVLKRAAATTFQWTVVLAILLFVWARTAPNVDRIFLVGPGPVFDRLAEWLGDGTLWGWMQTSVSTALLGLTFGSVAGIVLATVVGLGPPLVGELVEPVVSAKYAMPTFVFAPLIYIWLGNDFVPRVVFVSLACFPIVFIYTMTGIRTIDPARVVMMKLLGTSRTQLAQKLIVPSTLSYIATSLTIASKTSVVSALGAEILFGSSDGLGGRLYLNSQQFNTTNVLALLVTATIVATIYIRLFQVLRKVGSDARVAQ